MRQNTSQSWFTRFAKSASVAAGKPVVFFVALTSVIIWLVSGPFFGFTDSWQLVINTGTTILTFLMVFLIQNTQNREAEAVQVKLDELLRATAGAHNALLDLEELEQSDLDRIRAVYEQLAERARDELRRGASDTDVPDVPGALDSPR